jgi:hypothetical protein
MSSGWLTTKKRGRDDDLIERDRQTALAARHKKKPPLKQKPAVRKVSKHKDDDDDSMDSFIVKSDEELSEVEESDSEEDLDTFLNLTKRRVSKPPPVRPFNKLNRRPKAAIPLKKKPEVVNLDDDSSDDELEIIDAPKESRFFAKHDTTARTQTNVGGTVSFVSETKDVDESDSDESVPVTKPKSRTKKFDESDDTVLTTTTKYKPTKKFDDSDSDDSLLATKVQNQVSSLSDDSDNSIVASRKVAPAKKVNTPHALDHDSDDDEDNGPALTGRLRKKLENMNKNATQLKQTNRSKKSKFKAFQDEDEDEAIAVALAMSRSERENKSNEYIDDMEDDPNMVNMLLDESSEEERDDEQDDYVDPAAKEATSILEQANSLSAQIIETLSRWSSSSDGNSATMGLITNGALSLSTMAHAQNSKDHKWISAEVMASICPNITLAEYQLIGVNWMALLHGMKCKVNGSRGHSNVNGILADGKIVCASV